MNGLANTHPLLELTGTWVPVGWLGGGEAGRAGGEPGNHEATRVLQGQELSISLGPRDPGGE